MIQDGELDVSSIEEEHLDKHSVSQEFAEELHNNLIQNMSHLSQQEDKGLSGMNRWNEIFRILIMFLLIGGVVWFLFYRK